MIIRHQTIRLRTNYVKADTSKRQLTLLPYAITIMIIELKNLKITTHRNRGRGRTSRSSRSSCGCTCCRRRRGCNLNGFAAALMIAIRSRTHAHFPFREVTNSPASHHDVTMGSAYLRASSPADAIRALASITLGIKGASPPVCKPPIPITITNIE